MKTKVCLKCKKEKPLSAEFFHRNKARKSGFQDYCKECVLKRAKEYYQRPEVKERYKERMKEYYQRPEVKERYKEWGKEYNQRPEVKERLKEYYQRPEVKEKRKEWSEEYYQRPEVKEKAKEYMKEMYKNNPEFRLSSNVRRSLSQSLKKFKLKKENKTFEILDFTLFDLISHLESQFGENMNWDNYGSYWHLDHIRPVSSFSFKSTKCPEFKECWDLNNLQPLEASENFSKNSFFEGVRHTYKKEKA